jgi:hypothetical protein
LIVHSKLERSSAICSGLEKLLRYRKILFVLILILGCWCGVAIDQWRKERYIAFSKLDFGYLYKYHTNISNLLIRPEWEPPQLDLDIKFKNFLRLEFFRKRTLDAMRNVTLRGNISPQENKRYVKAMLRVAHGERFPAKVRLKGVGRFHYQDEKWSMRVSIKGQNNFLGMKEFSLTHPKRRAMFAYWLLNQTLKREGLFSLRTPLVSVSINGKQKIYAVEEIPRKELINNNERREGLIVKFNQIHLEELVGTAGRSSDEYYNSSGLLFSVKTKDANDQHLRQFETATSLLESFRLGDLKAHEVFNVKRYATYLAISDTMNAWHGASWPNMRFYFDPVLAKFEPVPWDMFDEDNLDHGIDRMFRMDDLYNDPESAFFLQLFSDPIFVRKYISELVRVSSDEYADKLFEDLKEEIKAYSYILHKDHPLKSIPKDIERLYKHRDHIRKNYLQKAGLLSAQLVNLEQDEIVLKLDGTSVIPLDVIGLEVDGNILFRPESGTFSIPGINQRRQTSLTVRFVLEAGKLLGELDAARLFVNYRLWGSDEVHRATLKDKEV